MPSGSLAGGSVAGLSAAGGAGRRRFAALAIGSAVYTFALIVFGGIVRITGSGLGCGDDWPKCNGVWIPTFDLPTFIEWFHRLLAAGLIIPFAAMLLLAVRHRHEPGLAGRGGLLRPSAWIMVLLVVQALLGALTVKLELPASVTVAHFGLASLLLAIVVVAGVRAGALGGDSLLRAAGGPQGDGSAERLPAAGEARDRAARFARTAVSAAALGFLVVLLGALTANLGKTPGVAGAGPAAWACGVVDGGFWRSFPLCNGQLFPEGGPFQHTHWTHRVLAFLLFFHVLGGTIAAFRRAAPPAVRWSAAAALATIVLQLVVAAKLIFLYLPDSLQMLHLFMGAAVWTALAVWAALAKHHSNTVATRGAVPVLASG